MTSRIPVSGFLKIYEEKDSRLGDFESYVIRHALVEMKIDPFACTGEHVSGFL
jgi:hypothetical protein